MENTELLSCSDALRSRLSVAEREGWVALDTEFLRERTFYPNLCLLQLATAEGSVCVDPLGLEDLSPLREILGNPAVVKIFHSCRQDLEALSTRIENVAFRNIFDTQLAASFCGQGEQISYAALVEQICEVTLPKEHTRTDWSRRPLLDEQIHYALDDVNYLPALYREFTQRLSQNQRSQWHRDECAQVSTREYYSPSAETAWQRLRGITRLSPEGQMCARHLATWREQRAQRSNRPRTWILATPLLLRICHQRPASVAALAEIQDMPKGVVKNSGRAIINVLQEAQRESCAELVQIPAPGPAERKLIKKIMAFINQRAEAEQISRGLLTKREEVEALVFGQRDTPLFSGWRAELVGNEILAKFMS